MNEASKFDRLPKTLDSVRDFNAGKGILLFLIGALLYVGHAAFIPVALAMLAALILSSPVEMLFRWGLPRGFGAGLILILVLGAMAGLVALIWTPSQQWYASAPHTLSVVQKKFTPVARLVGRIEELTNRAGKVTAVNPAEPAPAVAVPQGGARSFLTSVGDSAAGLASFVIITLFLLAGGPPMVARMTAAFFDHLKANHVQRYIEKVRGEVGHFYVTTALINIGLGIATTLVMWAWGMPTPYLWGALAAIVNFIPYAGATTTLLVVTLVAIVSFDVGHAVGVALSDFGLAVLEGQVVQPLLVGRRLDVNPLLIFLGLWFGGIFWGIAGVILATPILVALKVIAENALNGQSMLQFLGPNDPSKSDGSKRLLRPLKGRKKSEAHA